jgi:hypothetical protein
MFRQQIGWLGGALFLAAIWLESCGAVTIEPATPDEPPTAAPPPSPRLMRRDAGSDDAKKAEDDHS